MNRGPYTLYRIPFSDALMVDQGLFSFLDMKNFSNYISSSDTPIES
jgi:hypothetical protein